MADVKNPNTPQCQDEPDWQSFDFTETGSWPELWPPVSYRRNGDRLIRFRFMPPERAVNGFGTLHGAFLAGVAENCLGLFLHEPGSSTVPVVTVSLSLDYVAPGRSGCALEGEVELIRDSFRMQFVHIRLEQEGETIVHGSGILRKVKAA